MPKNKILGIDIGNYRIKMTLCQNNVPVRFVSERVPEHLVKDGRVTSWDAAGDFIKELMKANGISCRTAAVAMPENTAYIRRMELPLMTISQLKVNLPFEFHDCITEDLDKYIYDYAVIGRNEKKMELLAVAASKDLIQNYTAMCRRAGLRLEIIAPEVIAFRTIIQDFEKRHSIEKGSRDYVILDAGDRTINLHFFPKGEYEITRSMEPGCHELAKAYAEAVGLNEKTVKNIDMSSLDDQKDIIQDDQQIQDLYNSMAVQIMRVLNFYSFNNPNNNIDKLYYCGGGSRIDGLMKEIAENVELPQISIADLIETKPEFDESMILGPQSLGITMF